MEKSQRMKIKWFLREVRSLIVFFTRQEAGSITIPIDQIEKVAFSEGGLTNGFIAFVRKGDKRPHSVFSAMKQDNAVVFRLTKNDAARELAEYVKALI